MNKTFYRWSLFTICFFFLMQGFCEARIAYRGAGGRFGDQLLAYIRAQWIAYNYNIPLVYKKFLLSNELILSKIHEKERFSEIGYKKEEIDNININKIEVDNKIIYSVLFFPEGAIELESYQKRWGKRYFPIDWIDEGFRDILKDKIAPIKELKTIKPPENVISIALHFREGGGHDNFVSCNSNVPGKFPPIQFYGNCLLKMFETFPRREIYCFVFTDAKESEKIIDQLHEYLGDNFDKISFDWRKAGNSCKKNILEDFFSFKNFDIIIRPDSNFSLVPSLIYDYAAVLTPKHAVYSKEQNQKIIDEINISINEKLCQKLLDGNRFIK